MTMVVCACLLDMPQLQRLMHNIDHTGSARGFLAGGPGIAVGTVVLLLYSGLNQFA
jgi:hypothetical protein